ncbi:MAG: hypothetical protein Kow0037_20350 [Calditrichia bacterium]
MRTMLFFILMGLLFFGCSDKEKLQQMQTEIRNLNSQLEEARAELKAAGKDHEKMEILARKLKGIRARIVTDLGNIEVSFFPEKAPLHTFSFVTRAESGFYNGTQFHRVIPGFMIQGGDPLSKDNKFQDDGTGGPIANIPHEFNDIRHTPGILSMARTANLGAGAGSQFFIMHGDAPHLDGQYTAFGKVESGMDVVDKIARAKTFGGGNPSLRDHPRKPIRIKKIEVFRQF